MWIRGCKCFVNPTQFNNQNDLATYPRTVEADCEKLEQANVDVAFIPTVEEVYPEPDTRVLISALSPK